MTRAGFRNTIMAALLALAVSAVPTVASAQATGQGTEGYGTTQQTQDDGMDWGWIGLLGLAGLLGLRRREPARVDTTRTTRP